MNAREASGVGSGSGVNGRVHLGWCAPMADKCASPTLGRQINLQQSYGSRCIRDTVRWRCCQMSRLTLLSCLWCFFRESGRLEKGRKVKKAETSKSWQTLGGDYVIIPLLIHLHSGMWNCSIATIAPYCNAWCAVS